MRVKAGRGRFLNTLSGRFLILTVAFVMLAEVLIFLPSIARFRADYIMVRLEKAQIASMALLVNNDQIAPALEKELLVNAGVFNVVLRRDEVRQLALSSPIPATIYDTYDLRLARPWTLIHDAVQILLDPVNRVIRVIGNPVQQAGLSIEITMETRDLREAMIDYALQILFFSAMISGVTAVLLFIAVQRMIVAPIRRVVRGMQAYAEAPEDGRRILRPSSDVVEVRLAEDALGSMQTHLTAALLQKERLAQLGGAVSKISHDLRNILTTAQLFVDRLEGSDDPVVARSAPKIVASITRAVNLCEATLAFGKAEEAPPKLEPLALRALVQDIAEGEGMGTGEDPHSELVSVLIDMPQDLTIRADSEQLFRVLSNLLRNARQAIEATGKSGTIEVSAGEDDQQWWIRVGDTGPGLPAKARDHLFAAFQGGARKGGTGLGLAIAADLIRGHGGKLELVRTDEDGTEFEISLPKAISENSFSDL